MVKLALSSFFGLSGSSRILVGLVQSNKRDKPKVGDNASRVSRAL
jgi:hypothetical protein